MEEEEEEEAEEAEDDEDAGVTLLARCAQLPEWGEDFTEVFLPEGQRTVKRLRQALAQEFEVSIVHVDDRYLQLFDRPDVVVCRRWTRRGSCGSGSCPTSSCAETSTCCDSRAVRAWRSH
jgi:hypothetical protein